MAISKVEFGGNTLIDITDTTATASDVLEGIIFYKADGTRGVGTLNIVDTIYPVGSIYTSVESTSPATLFGGTWEQLEDRFLLGAGSTYTSGDTGGEATHTLTTSEIPSHNHDIRYRTKIVASGSSGAWALGGGTYTGTTDVPIQDTGGGNSHNNMPPYLVVYMWKRTA